MNTLTEKFLGPAIPERFYWFNEPARYGVGEGLEIVTEEKTDFWQRTHYGFQRDNGHCLLTKRTGDFSLLTRVKSYPKEQYDQCGLMVRIDSQNWIKLSTEYENEHWSRLGAVVTHQGFSDWSSRDISSDYGEMWYRINKNGRDFLLEHSFDGLDWQQLRITHLHEASETIEAGVYACSPLGKDFRCRFTSVEIAENDWYYQEA